MVRSRLQAALLVCHVTSVFSLSIPTAQQITGSGLSLGILSLNRRGLSIASKIHSFFTNSQVPSSSNLTIPSPIPGFETRPLFDRTPTLPLDEVYANAIEFMALLAERFYSTPIPGPIDMSSDAYDAKAKIQVIPWPQPSPQFQGKHVIQAIYDAGMALAAKPVTRLGYVPRLYAGLFLENRQVGFLKWQPKQNSVAGAPSSSSTSLINAVNSTSTLLLAHGDGLTEVQESSGVIVDPRDSKFKIKCKFLEEDIYSTEVFSAFLDAMATAARSDMTATGAYVNSPSISGTAALDVHEVILPLSWSRLIRTLTLLWEELLRHISTDVDFEMFYDESKIGEGFLMSLARSKTSMVSSG